MNPSALEGSRAHAAGKGYLDNPYLDTPGKETEMCLWIDGYVAALIAARNAKEPAP